MLKVATLQMRLEKKSFELFKRDARELSFSERGVGHTTRGCEGREVGGKKNHQKGRPQPTLSCNPASREDLWEKEFTLVGQESQKTSPKGVGARGKGWGKKG